jgi:hypothetical protein
MNTRRLLLISLIFITISSLVAYFIFDNLTEPIPVKIIEITQNPEYYHGKEVKIEGVLRKSWFMTYLIHNLTDSGSSITVSGEMDLDAYTGLNVALEGTINYEPKLLGGPKLRLNANSVIESSDSPHLFLQWEQIGGIAGLNDVFIIDNNSTVSYLRRGKIHLENTLNQSELQRVNHIIVENGFLSIQKDQYIAKDNTADYFSYKLKVILLSDSQLQTKTVTWVDEWASEETLPDNLKIVQSELQQFIEHFLQ